MAPQPLAPDYVGRCLTRVLEAVGDRRGPPALSDLLGAIDGARSVVLVVLDGLGQLQLEARLELAPTLAGGLLAPLTSVAPSTTAAALTSLTTGTTPGEHGIVGYRMQVGDDVLQTLRWTVDGRGAAHRHPPERVQRCAPKMVRRGIGVPYVGKSAFATSAFTAAHLQGADYLGADSPEEIAETAASRSQEASLVLAYHDAIDKVAHVEGLGGAYESAIEEADAMVAAIRRASGPDVAVVVTADHGQVDVGPTEVPLGASILGRIDHMSGEGRFRWLHAQSGESSSLLEACRSELEGSCWVRSRRELLAEGWLGEVEPEVEERLGDVAVLPYVDAFVADPMEPLEARMRSRHGSLTEAEILVPLIVL